MLALLVLIVELEGHSLEFGISLGRGLYIGDHILNLTGQTFVVTILENLYGVSELDGESVELDVVLDDLGGCQGPTTS